MSESSPRSDLKLYEMAAVLAAAVCCFNVIVACVCLLIIGYWQEGPVFRLVEFESGMQVLNNVHDERLQNRIENVEAEVAGMREFQSRQYLLSLPKPDLWGYGDLVNDLVLIGAAQEFAIHSNYHSVYPTDPKESFVMVEQSLDEAIFTNYLGDGAYDLAASTRLCWEHSFYGWCYNTASMVATTFEDPDLLSATYEHGRSGLLGSIANIDEISRWRLVQLLDLGLIPAFSPDVDAATKELFFERNRKGWECKRLEKEGASGAEACRRVELADLESRLTEVVPGLPAAFEWRMSLEYRKGDKIVAAWEQIFEDLAVNITYDQEVIDLWLGTDSDTEDEDSVFSPDAEPEESVGGSSEDLFEGIECGPGMQPMIGVELDTGSHSVSVTEAGCVPVFDR